MNVGGKVFEGAERPWRFWEPLLLLPPADKEATRHTVMAHFVRDRHGPGIVSVTQRSRLQLAWVESDVVVEEMVPSSHAPKVVEFLKKAPYLEDVFFGPEGEGKWDEVFFDCWRSDENEGPQHGLRYRRGRLYYTWVRPFSAPSMDRRASLKSLVHCADDCARAVRYRGHGWWTCPKTSCAGGSKPHSPFLSTWLFGPCSLTDASEEAWGNRYRERCSMAAEDKWPWRVQFHDELDAECTAMNFLQEPEDFLT